MPDREVTEPTRIDDLITFFLHLRDKGEDNIGMTIEQFVDDYIKRNPINSL